MVCASPPANLDTLLSRYETGDTVDIIAFRLDELIRFDVKLATRAPIKFALEINPKSGVPRDDCAKAGLAKLVRIGVAAVDPLTVDQLRGAGSHQAIVPRPCCCKKALLAKSVRSQ